MQRSRSGINEINNQTSGPASGKLFREDLAASGDFQTGYVSGFGAYLTRRWLPPSPCPKQ